MCIDAPDADSKVCIKPLQEMQLVTYSGSCLYVIDPGLGTFVACHCNIGTITSVAIHGDEIFVLRQNGFRRILRLACTPDPYQSKILLLLLHKQVTIMNSVSVYHCLVCA